VIRRVDGAELGGIEREGGPQPRGGKRAGRGLLWAVSRPARLISGFAWLRHEPRWRVLIAAEPIPHDSALTSASAQLFFAPNWSVLVKFDGEFASGSQTYAGSGILRYTW